MIICVTGVIQTQHIWTYICWIFLIRRIIVKYIRQYDIRIFGYFMISIYIRPNNCLQYKLILLRFWQKVLHCGDKNYKLLLTLFRQLFAFTQNQANLLPQNAGLQAVFCILTVTFSARYLLLVDEQSRGELIVASVDLCLHNWIVNSTSSPLSLLLNYIRGKTCTQIRNVSVLLWYFTTSL